MGLDELTRLLVLCDVRYKNDYISICLDNYKDKLSKQDIELLKEGTSLEKVPCFVDVITEDLQDKGFSNEEIYNIITTNLTKDVAYKYIAYVVSLTNDYDCLEEFNELIENDFNSNPIDKETFEYIYKAYQTLE